MKDKIIDGIMGLAVADALGVPVEFQSRESLLENPVVNMRSYGTYNQPAGTWSDDSSMTFCLIDSLSKGLDYMDIMKKFMSWYKDGEYTPHGLAFDIGGSTRNALKRFEKGVNPFECGGKDVRDNGNGALMRILPMVFFLEGSFGRENLPNKEALELIHNVAALTHGHKRSKIACGIYSCIAHNLVYDNDLKNAIRKGIQEAKDIYERTEEFSLEWGFTTELNFYKRIFDIEEFAELDMSEIQSSGYVVDTLEAAIWCLLNSNDYAECVLKAVNLGEDTDTVAAVTGGLAGIFYGVDSIPRDWIDTIVKKEYIYELCDRFRRSIELNAISLLTSYIPYFREAMNRKFCKYEDSKRDERGVIIAGFPIYEDEFNSFHSDVYRTNFIDYNYDNTIEKYLGREKRTMNENIEKAEIDLVKAILTYHLRAEHFGDGNWEESIKDGVFLRLLERLEVIAVMEDKNFQENNQTILLNDILKFTDFELANVKIRFNKSNNGDYDPIKLFKEKDEGLYTGQFWNYSKNKSFQVGQIAFGFIKIDSDKWLLFDISKITKDLDKFDGVGYEHQTLEKYSKYFGRLIIRYKNKSQNMIRKADSVIGECEVYEIINDTFSDDDFPGYENVDLSWKELKRVLDRKDWKTALENQKGVYLITDINTGRRYVGSAYGENMILGRWKSYIHNGHGGNKDFTQIEFEYIKENFRFSILEIYKSTTEDRIIINREHFWMRILLTRDKRFGYNN